MTYPHRFHKLQLFVERRNECMHRNIFSLSVTVFLRFQILKFYPVSSKLKTFLGPMDRLHCGQNFEKSGNRKIYYHSIEEHPKIGKIAKSCCETL